MYKLLRRIHLFTGLILLVFVLMYFLSGYVIIHAQWFGGRDPKTSSRTEQVNLSAGLSDAALVRYFQAKLRLQGQASSPEHRKDGSIRVNFVRPGKTVQIVLNSQKNQVTVKQNEFGFAGIANGMHRLRGYHGGWLYCTWALMYDLASVALMVFSITGVVLWYQSTPGRLPGGICLLASCSFTVSMILYLLLSK